ncbi:SWIM zinc finger family protein [Streptomyces sp. MMS24-I31]|uniref:SWIM zinc finger family protein n=1 Tax=Streptomyces sp. MMS24-I31 TaxID=3351563 RepID=UPI0038968654
MDERPADEARRALRAARQRRTPAGTPEGARGPMRRDPETEQPAGEANRPAAAARDALRGAVLARRGDRPTDGGVQGPQAEAAEDTTDGASTGRSPEPAGDPAAAAPIPAPPGEGPAAPEQGTGPRPADAAREALRAALAHREARTEQNRTAPATAAATTGRAPTRPAAGDAPARSDTAGPRRDLGARHVRELLTGALRMPADATEPTREPGGTGGKGSGKAPERMSPAPPSPGGDHRPPPGGHGSEEHPPEGHAPLEHPGTTPTPTPVPQPAPGRPVAPAAPASPQVPRTMASPRRDGELRRTFPAFTDRAPDGSGFAETWWGNAWVTALEEGALDAARLARGRGYAEKGHVDAITVTPGQVLAYVQGSRPRPYRVQVRLRTLDDADWDRFLDAAAERPGHIAALLDKEMPQSLADCGVPLLPGPGDLEPHCSCPDRGHPCKHAAALCYRTARLLDADPFVLLLLRGRGERELLDALSRLSATRAARAAQEREPEPLPSVRAGDALAPRRLPPLPAPLPPPPHPGQPPVYPAAPGGPDPFALDQLATDAAARAHALLTTGRDPVGGLTLWQDAVRLAAARPGSGLTAATRSLYASLASAAGRTPAELARAVAAWRQGGPEGLAVLEEPWDPPAGRFDRARPLLLAADLPAFRPRHNRLTHPGGHVQLRLGRDGLWYAYESEPGRDDWWPRGTPDLDPVGALTGLGTPGDL